MQNEPYRSRSLGPGILISLLIHAALATLLLSRRPAPPAAEPARWLTVSIVPAPQRVPAAAPVPPAAPSAPLSQPRARTTRQAPALAATPLRPRDKDQAPESAAITVMPAPPAAPATAADPPDPFATPAGRPSGAFDTNAALQSARKLAVAKAGRDDPAVAQLRDKPAGELASESQLGKGIKRGVRPDCLTSGASAGILAPLVIAAQVLTDKKDHGCKW